MIETQKFDGRLPTMAGFLARVRPGVVSRITGGKNEDLYVGPEHVWEIPGDELRVPFGGGLAHEGGKLWVIPVEQMNEPT